jgi:uncharacterized FlaG/YvyC family protein
MDFGAIDRVSQIAPAPVAAIPNEPAQNREVVQAVRALNQAEMFGDNNELRFQRDQGTRRMVIRIVNRVTDEVIAQVPPEYVLRLAENLKTP